MASIKEPTVLLLDDDNDDRYLIRTAMRDSEINMNLIEFSDAHEAWAYLARCSDEMPKLIVLDLNMPELNGFEFLKLLRSSTKTKLTPVVVYTTSTDNSDLMRSYELGANSFVVKPLGYQDIQRVFKQISEFWLNTALAPANYNVI